MKRKITFLSAALMLLAFLAVPLGMWGQSYSLYSGQLVEGDYLIYYNGKAMNTTTTSNRLQYAEVTPANDVITTNLTNIVWHIAPDGDYWTIYNASAAKYAVSTGTKNQATTSQTLDDKARWTVSGTSTYEFVNKYNNDNNINKNLRNNGTYGFACYSTSTGGALSLYKLEESQGDTPSITAYNVELAYDATEGAIAYTINNPVDNGSITASTESEWLLVDSEAQSSTSGSFDLLCDANTGDARIATVTLTYTYGEESITKDVTVTQAAAPVIYTTIPELFAAATSTETSVLVNFDSWVVSGVSTNGKNVFVTDNEGNGFVIYSSANMSETYSVGDILSGEISCTLKLYNGFAELLNVNAEDLTITEGGTLTEVFFEMANLSGVNTGALLHYDNLTCNISNNKYYLTDGTTTLQVYNSLYAFEALSDGATYNITGIYQQYNSTKEILPRNAEDVEEVIISEPSVTVAPDNVTAPYTSGQDLGEFTITVVNINNPYGSWYRFFDPANPETPAGIDPDWIQLSCSFNPDEGTFSLLYNINENNEFETRTACFKYVVTYLVGESPVYVMSNLITLTQEGKPLPTVAVDPYVTELETPDNAEGSLAIVANNIDINASQINYYELVENEFVLVEEAPAWLGLQVNQDDYSVINYYVETNTGDARTAYFKLGLQSYPDMQYYYSEMVTISQAAYVAPEPPTAGWVLTNLSDLTANDIFVIVGTTSGGDSYAMSNDNGIGSAPAAVEVTVADEGTHLTGDIADNIKWNISGSANDGYTFYPNGDTESWLYCTATNNGVRVGTNDNNTFSLSDEGYLNNDATGRYVGIYNSSDWRCYTSINSNITGQTFAFYKKVGDEPQPVVASITIDPDFLTVDAGMHYGDDFLPLTYENIIVENAQSFGLQFYTAEGEETGMPTWFYAMVTPQTGSDAYQVTVATMPNDGDARSTYFKVYAYDADSTLVYSNLATVTQDAPVYDYAVLPFVWEGGSSADFAALNGVTLSGNGSDYASNHAPYLIKFDSDGDFIMVKTDSQPGTVTIGVKMIGGGNTSTITVQGSADGETFTDIEVLTISGAQNDILTLETTNAFGDNDRYVKLLFTKGSNVGVGPITITKGTAPSITLSPDTFNLDAVGPLNGMHLPTATVTYHNFEITQASDFHVQFYNAEGEEQEMPTWLLHTEVSGPITDSSSYQSIYQSISIVTANEGPARSAYYRVYAFDADSIPVYSNLVTYNQAAGAYITVNPDVVNVDAALHTAQLPITYENIVVENFQSFDVQFYNAEGEETAMPDWLVVQATGMNEEYQVTCAIMANEGEARTTYFKVYAMDAESNLVYSNLITINQEAYVAPSSDENYVLFSGDLVEGDYVIYYNGYAMKNVVENSRLSYSTVTPTEDVITNPASDIVWHIAPYGEYWTIYNAELDQFAASTGAKNKAQLMESGSDDKALWTVTDSEGTYEFVNKKNSDNNVNANLRNNGGYGFACYASTTGGALSLYKCSTPVSTFTKEITGYEDNEGGYYLIASPVVATAPSADNGFLTNAYDLYKFDQTKVGEEWYNYETNAFNLTAGKGYLYASQESTTLTFMGIPYSGDGIIQLSFDADHTWGDENYYWNLVGNPFGDTAYIDRPFYAMNETGTEIMSTASQGAVAAMQGVFVLATEDGETLTFTTEEAPVAAANVTLNLSQNRGAVIDRTIVRFGEGRQLPKFQLNTESTKLYIPQGNNDYAVVRSAAYGEMPVNFKAQNNGSYTISVNAENAEANYLHLIDNMTGNDIDLLATPSYSFEAKTTDYASRFRLVFNITGVEENTNSTEPFAFFNGSEWVISNIGKATLQMVDLTGRILSSESISGNATVSTANLSTGIYLMRLVNGENVKTQKIVVK